MNGYHYLFLSFRLIDWALKIYFLDPENQNRNKYSRQKYSILILSEMFADGIVIYFSGFD